MKKIYFILFISVFLFSLNGEASDTDSLWIGNMNISIGMEKNKVINILSENYEVIQHKMKTEDSTREDWSIYKKTKKRKSEDLIGMLAFQKGKVALIEKSWGGFGGNEVASFGQEFVKLLSKLSKEEKNNITIQINETKEPGISLKLINLSSGKHGIIIIVSDEGINMQEDLSK